jgi:predicted nucleic acid-binding protein
MKLVVDSNILIASLLKDGITRSLLMEAAIEFLSPEHMLAEIRKHRPTIAKRAGLSQAEFDLLYALISERISVVEADSYKDCMAAANQQIGHRDSGDAPFLALALAAGCGLWTYNEKHFEGAAATIWSTADVAGWVRAASAA